MTNVDTRSKYDNNGNVSKLEGTNAVQDYLDGMTLKAIGEKYGASRPAVSKWLKKQGVEIKPKHVSQTKYPFNEHWLDEMDCQEKWYFLGFMYADGNVDMKKGNYRVRIKLKADPTEKELLVRFYDLFKCNREPGYETQNGSDGIFRESWTFQLANRHLCERLIELGCVEKKSLVVKFPDFVPADNMRHFIRGVFDGDGSILLREDGKLANIRIVGTEDMMQGIYNEVLKHTGIEGVFGKCTGKNLWKFDIAHQRDIRDFCAWLYQDATIYLGRKYDNYTQFVKTRDFSKETQLEVKARLESESATIIQEYLNGVSMKQIARNFSCSDAAISRLLERHGVK